MDELVQKLVEDLRSAGSLKGPALANATRRGQWLADLSREQLTEFFSAVVTLVPLSAHADLLLSAWLISALSGRKIRRAPSGNAIAPAELIPAIERLYRELGPDSHARKSLLTWLAEGDTEALEVLARLLTTDPPQEERDVMQALAPLFQVRRPEAASLFPALFGALAQPTVAAPVLDLANFLTREKVVPRHPGAELAGQFSALLGEVVQSLTLLEERPMERSGSPAELGRRVSQGVALAVSLCDALAQIGDESAIPKLRQALEIRHRRVRTEAAAALARLGDKAGEEQLIQLAAEPVARLRVLAYAEELGLADKIDPQFATPQARAEAELCVWLAEPTQFGVPPTKCELFDRRMQFWPGYSEPVECFLFRFQFVVTIEGEGERSFSNIGIAGPLAHAFVADLGDLPPDDIYAAFAGWHGSHDEILEFDVARLSKSEKLEVERLKRRLHDAGYAKIEPQTMGYFFGDKSLVATADREGVPGVAVADFADIAFFPQRSSRALGPSEAYCIYKGRKLLKTFNEKE